jgi:flagellar motor switch protein FliM
MEAPDTRRSDAPAAERQDSIKQYDFKSPGKLGGEKTEGIALAHSTQARRIGIGLGGLLRDTVVVSVEAVRELGCGEMLQSMPTACTAFEFTTESLEIAGLIDIEPGLAFSFVDRLFGGKGEPLEEVRELTAIEKKVIRKVGEVLLRELAAVWTASGGLKMNLGRVVSKRADISEYSSGESFIVVGFRAKTSAAEGALRVAYPYTMLAPLVRTVAPVVKPAVNTREKGEVARQVGAFPIQVSAALGASMIAIKDLLNLQKGDVLVLDNNVTDEVIVNVGARRAFLGRPGSHSGKLAVRITRAIEEGGNQNEPC